MTPYPVGTGPPLVRRIGAPAWRACGRQFAGSLSERHLDASQRALVTGQFAMLPRLSRNS